MRLANKALVLAGWLFVFYFAKDARGKTKILIESMIRDFVPAAHFVSIFEREFASPFVQIDNSERFCQKFAGYKVFVTEYRWHPLCLDDEFSAMASIGFLSDVNIVSDIYKNHGKVLKFDNGRDFIYLYK